MAHVATQAQAREDFHSYIEKEQLLGTNGSSAGAEQPFTPLSQLTDYWTHEEIKRALGLTIYSSHDLNTIQKRYLRVFSTLVFIRKPELISILIHRDAFEDQRLPFYPSYQGQPKHWPSSPEDFQPFFETQWRFCVPLLHRQRLMSGDIFDEEMILPFRRKKSLSSSGNSATTMLIELHPEYNRILDRDYPVGTTTNSFVLKTYHGSKAKIYYENEMGSFKRLMHPRKYVENMIIFYGSFQHGNTYNILLEYADRGTLLDFFHSIHPPSTYSDIICFWTRLFDIVRALHCIHELEEPGLPPPLILRGIHQDIKPANILVCSQKFPPEHGEISEYDVIFKIADLGLSHFEAKMRVGSPEGARDTCGTPMYSAPECCRIDFLQQNTIKVTSAIDIWSLGCVFSEAATWVVLGQKGREDYRRLRHAEIEQDLKSDGYDGCFHDGKDVLRAVNKMHTLLREVSRKSDYITERFTDHIEMMLDSKPLRRYSADQLFRTCRQIIQRAEDGTFPDPLRVHSPSPPSRRTETSEPATLAPIEPQTPPQLPTEHSISPNSMFSYQLTPRPPDMTPHQMLHLPNRTLTYPQRGIGELGHMPGGSSAGLGLGSTARSRRYTGKSPNIPTAYVQSPIQIGSRSSIKDSKRTVPSKVNFDHSPTILPYPSVNERSDDNHSVNGVSSSRGSTPVHQPAQFTFGANGVESTPPMRTPKSPSLAKTHEMLHFGEVPMRTALHWSRRPKKCKGPPHAIDSILGRLEGRDHVFLLDDSESMRQYWPDVVTTFKGLANIVKEADPDGIDLYFTNSPDTFHHKNRNWDKLVRIIENRTLAGRCDMKTALKSIIDNFSADFDALENTKRRSFLSKLAPVLATPPKTKRGLSVYILTDGVWQDGPDPVCNVEQPIQLIVEKLTENRQLDTRAGIQFIQFGDDPVGNERLNFLDEKLVETYEDIDMDIVDTTPHDGDVLKMLLGALDRHWDGDPRLAFRTSNHRFKTHPKHYRTNSQNNAN